MTSYRHSQSTIHITTAADIRTFMKTDDLRLPTNNGSVVGLETGTFITLDEPMRNMCYIIKECYVAEDDKNCRKVAEFRVMVT